MSVDLPAAPDGFHCVFHDQLDSTNAEALRRAGDGEINLWIWAGRQTGGRGRLGRTWDSPAGNLYASLLARPECDAGTAMQLAFVAGLAACDAVREVAGKPATRGALALKWPNDVLLGGEKLGGILLESYQPAGGGIAVAIGTGLNLASHPDGLASAATSLAAHGENLAVCDMLEALMGMMARWLSIWSDGAGFGEVRDAWSDRSIPKGTPIGVGLDGGRHEGRYGGISREGALLLELDSGETERITVGDVFLR